MASVGGLPRDGGKMYVTFFFLVNKIIIFNKTMIEFSNGKILKE